MSRRFRRRPPPWFWLALAVAAALAGRGYFSRDAQGEALALPDEAVVTSVIDGRTLEIAGGSGGLAVRVRMIGIRTLRDDESRQWLSDRLLRQTVRIERDKRRRAGDGALLAYIYLGDELINAELIRDGHAAHQPYPGDSESYARRLRQAALK